MGYLNFLYGNKIKAKLNGPFKKYDILFSLSYLFYTWKQFLKYLNQAIIETQTKILSL